MTKTSIRRMSNVDHTTAIVWTGEHPDPIVAVQRAISAAKRLARLEAVMSTGPYVWYLVLESDVLVCWNSRSDPEIQQLVNDHRK
jgi:hypothetical protein